MNILILTAKCGMGHYSVSTSLKQQLEGKNVNVEIFDFFKFAFPKIQSLIYGTFNFLVSKCSRVYNFFYKFTANDNSAPLNNFVNKKISELIEEKKPDIIISTFPVCSKYISAYKKQKNNNIKLYTYITDVNVNKEWITDETDGYFVASEDTKEQLENFEINSDKIKIVGIPVKNEFKEKLYNKEKNEILIMGGGLGLISFMDKELKKLLENKDIHVTLITGKNKKLFKKYYNKFDNLTVISYTNEVYKYMEKASLIISKAGGVTLFEAINSNTPICVLSPFLSQEVGNAEFIEKNKIGKVIWKNSEFSSDIIINLLKTEFKLENMKENMRRISEKFENYNVIKMYGESEKCY